MKEKKSQREGRATARIAKMKMPTNTARAISHTKVRGDEGGGDKDGGDAFESATTTIARAKGAGMKGIRPQEAILRAERLLQSERTSRAERWENHERTGKPREGTNNRTNNKNNGSSGACHHGAPRETTKDETKARTGVASDAAVRG